MNTREIRAIGTKRQGVATTGRQPGDPTQSEIRAACLKMQAEWSPAERMRRGHCEPAVDMTVVHDGD